MSEFNMSGKDWDKIINYSHIAWEKDKSEIGGMMIATKEGNDFLLSDPVILKQQVSGSNTVLDKEALAQYYGKTAIKNAGKDIIFVWWHSHHTMAAFWSGTDLATIDTTKSGSVSMSLVVNLKEEYLFRVNLWEPIKAHKDVSINIIRPERKIPKSLYNEYDKLVSDIVVTRKVNKPKFKYQYNRTYNHHYKWNDFNSFPDLSDDEYVDVEAKVDDMLSLFYVGELGYKKLKKQITTLNNKLAKDDSELRVELPAKPILESVIKSGYFDRHGASKLIVCNTQGKLPLWKKH